MSTDPEKRARILRAAMEEFLKGYGKANTDVIVEKAGISKGLLFHYFGSKKGLFLFLMQYAIDVVSAEYEKAVAWNKDFIETIWDISMIAVDLLTVMPLVLRFMGGGVFVIQEEFPEEAGLFGNPLDRLFKSARGQMDRSLFRKDIDVEKASDLIMWTIYGYNNRIAGYDWRQDGWDSQIEQIKKELRDYLDMLRKLLYKDAKEV
ncbi:TetR/AcrR family transcriptional regulator [Lacrimispora sp.]|uniref:TetR/AcrR family transcriptional regulator n=1 Tax=Lacrimispora sp. TaxID=2719234 RepID=UPI00345FBB3E